MRICSLEISEMVLTKCTNPEETEESIVSASSRMHPVLVFNGVSEDGISTTFKMFNCLVQKGVILTPWLHQDVG